MGATLRPAAAKPGAKGSAGRNPARTSDKTPAKTTANADEQNSLVVRTPEQHTPHQLNLIRGTSRLDALEQWLEDKNLKLAKAEFPDATVLGARKTEKGGWIATQDGQEVVIAGAANYVPVPRGDGRPGKVERIYMSPTDLKKITKTDLERAEFFAIVGEALINSSADERDIKILNHIYEGIFRTKIIGEYRTQPIFHLQPWEGGTAPWYPQLLDNLRAGHLKTTQRDIPEIRNLILTRPEAAMEWQNNPHTSYLFKDAAAEAQQVMPNEVEPAIAKPKKNAKSKKDKRAEADVPITEKFASLVPAELPRLDGGIEHHGAPVAGVAASHTQQSVVGRG